MVFTDRMIEPRCKRRSNSAGRPVLNHGQNWSRSILNRTVAALLQHADVPPAKTHIYARYWADSVGNLGHDPFVVWRR
jgi:hypothetical protein